ncbi:hypothetical protein ScPMuIL_014259 [Solemya velum]
MSVNGIDSSTEKETKSKFSNPFKDKSLTEIPCFRKAFLTGITSGLGAGLGYFFWSSNARKSAHIAFGSYFVITTSTWFYCRYRWSADRFRNQQMKTALQTKILAEGTELEQQIQAETGDV